MNIGMCVESRQSKRWIRYCRIGRSFTHAWLCRFTNGNPNDGRPARTLPPYRTRWPQPIGHQSRPAPPL